MRSDISARAMCVNPIQHIKPDVQLEEIAQSLLEIIVCWKREKVKFFPHTGSSNKFLHAYTHIS